MNLRETLVYPAPRFFPKGSLDLFETFQSQRLQLCGMSVARYRYDKPPRGVTEPNAPEASFMAVLPLRHLPPHHVFRAGQPLRMAHQAPSTISIFDFREIWTSELRPIETFNIFIPQSALIDLTESLGVERIERLSTGAELVASDPILFSLVAGVLPLLANTSKPSSLFLEHMLAAMCIHLAARYGGVDFSRVRAAGGLAPWQEKRAKDLMEDRLAEDIGIAELAQACGISARHFQRAFKNSTGDTPHQWRVTRRIGRAKTLLEDKCFTPSEIALMCGFADQSHLGRVFSRTVGCSPGAYRARRA